MIHSDATRRLYYPSHTKICTILHHLHVAHSAIENQLNLSIQVRKHRRANENEEIQMMKTLSTLFLTMHEMLELTVRVKKAEETKRRRRKRNIVVVLGERARVRLHRNLSLCHP